MPYEETKRSPPSLRRSAGHRPGDRDCCVLAATPSTSEEYYIAVASSPVTHHHIGPGEPLYYGIGWHPDSSYDAGKLAEQACRDDGGQQCLSTADGKSNQGGCVALVLGSWRDQDEAHPSSAYYASSSAWRDVAEAEALSTCEGFIHGGKDAGTVVQWRCVAQTIFCSSDVRNK